MPNWCKNILKVTGEEKDLKNFMNCVEGKDYDGKTTYFDFNKIIPYPKEFDDQDRKIYRIYKQADEYAKSLGKKCWNQLTDKEKQQCTQFTENDLLSIKDGYNSAGLNWRIEHWGTKWNAREVTRKKMKNKIYYTFLTAWDAPFQIIWELGNKFPNLTFDFKYNEPLMMFSGHMIIKNGKIIKDVEESDDISLDNGEIVTIKTMKGE